MEKDFFRKPSTHFILRCRVKEQCQDRTLYWNTVFKKNMGKDGWEDGPAVDGKWAENPSLVRWYSVCLELKQVFIRPEFQTAGAQ